MTVLAGAPASAAASVKATSSSGTAQHLLIGEYDGYQFPQDIDSYTAMAGASPHFVMWFQSWNEPLFYTSQQRGIDARSVVPIITWSPDSSSSFSMQDLVAGRYDSYIIAQAKLAKSWNKQIFIRIFHEMNGTWQTFGPTNVSSQLFVVGWRHVVDIFRAQGASNVKWVWSPNVYGAAPSKSTRSFDALYPGDSYVDWVGLDGYNFGTPWASWSVLYMKSYADITKLTQKPLMVAEWGTTGTGGDKSAWIRDAFLKQIPLQMPRIRAVVAFDRIAESDFRINSSPSALAAYQQAVKSTR